MSTSTPQAAWLQVSSAHPSKSLVEHLGPEGQLLRDSYGPPQTSLPPSPAGLSRWTCRLHLLLSLCSHPSFCLWFGEKTAGFMIGAFCLHSPGPFTLKKKKKKEVKEERKEGNLSFGQKCLKWNFPLSFFFLFPQQRTPRP